MNNLIIFKYNGKIWNPKNPEKKLRQLGITWNDVEIIKPQEKTLSIKEEDYNWRMLYKFKNRKTGETITSIYNNLDNLKEYVNVDDYEYVGI